MKVNKSDEYKVKSKKGKTKLKSCKIPGQRTGNISNIGNIISPGERIEQIVLYNLNNQSQETGDNTSI